METTAHNAPDGTISSLYYSVIYYLPIFQIQFCILLLHGTQALKTDCNVPKKVLFIWFPNVFTIFYMFYEFYRNTYTKQQKGLWKRMLLFIKRIVLFYNWMSHFRFYSSVIEVIEQVMSAKNGSYQTRLRTYILEFWVYHANIIVR